MSRSGALLTRELRHEPERTPGELAETQAGGRLEREPGAGVGRAADLVAQLAADDPDAVDDPDGVEAVLGLPGSVPDSAPILKR